MKKKGYLIIFFLFLGGTFDFLFLPLFCLADEVDTSSEVLTFSAPTNLTVTVVSTSQIDLSWSSVSDAVSYKVYRDGILVASPTTNSSSDTGLSPGTNYSYTVSAVNIYGGESSQSSSVSATTLSAPTLSAPRGGGMPARPTPPEGGFRILINDGVEYTNSPTVTLKLFGGPNTERMAISNNPDFTGLGTTGQVSYQSLHSWDICRGQKECPEGTYTVYAKFYAPWGRASEVVLDSIIYKKPIPESIIKQIQTKINEISKKIADLRKQITQLFEKEAVAEVPEKPPEEIVPLVKEVKEGPIYLLKEYGKWL